ncbi:MAG: GIY-YIG nuclease family protein, partial [Rhizomicrobium sp.]
MKYVYFLRSVDHPGQVYSGLTDDLRKRLKVRNAGGSPHTSKFKPWKLVAYVAFSDADKAI